jgi:hypothetical protein
MFKARNKLSFMGTPSPHAGPLYETLNGAWSRGIINNTASMNGATWHVPQRFFIALESVTLTICMIRVEWTQWHEWQLPAFGSRNPWTQRYFWHSVHGIREPIESSGVRSTESVNATRVLAFGPRNLWTQHEFWHSVHGIRVYNPGLKKMI